MEELDIAAVTKRSIHGVFALVTRTFLIQIISFAVNILLTIFLSPSIFGVYFVVTAVIAFLSYFSDIGLAAALIQKKEEVTSDDLKTTFTLQQLLVSSIVIVMLILSPFISNFYKLPSGGLQLFQALIIAFFLSSLKTIPSVILERSLKFEKLVIPQIVETLLFNLTALVLAVNGFGISSFSYAVLVRGISGLIAIYIISPWKIQIGLSRNVARKLLSFGIPFQTNSILALIKDDLLIAYVGKILPLAQVGYIGFAQKWAFTPLRLIMDNVIRITFPSFSRLQHERDHLSKAIEKSIFASTLFIFPSLAGLVILSPLFINIVPKYQKWEPALLSLGLFAINAALSSISTPLTNALNAIGKIKVTLYLMIFWTISTWILTPLLVTLMGFNGFAFASAVISLSVILVLYLTKKYIPFSVKTIQVPTIGTLVMSITLVLLISHFPVNIFSVLILIIIGTLVYFSTVYLMAKNVVIEDIAMIRNQFVKS